MQAGGVRVPLLNASVWREVSACLLLNASVWRVVSAFLLLNVSFWRVVSAYLLVNVSSGVMFSRAYSKVAGASAAKRTAVT
jgi:hypothetical protein